MKEQDGKAPRRRGRKGKNQDGGGDLISTHDGAAFKPHRTLLIHLTEETPTWYECGRNTQHRNETIYSLNRKNKNGTDHSKLKTNPHHIVSKYRTLADSIYRQEVSLFRSSSYSNSDKDEQWVENTMKRGTLKDRVAAMSVVVSSHPVHKVYALDMLLNLAGVATGENISSGQTNDRVGQMASEALTDLFTSTLLPSNRKLIGLEARPLYLYEENEGKNKLSISPRTLLLWRYEEILKEKYTGFITQYLGRTLAQSGTASLDLTKISCLRTACSLLRELPEGEQILLSLVVNKIGDPSKKVAAAAAHELRRTLEAHPNMTTIISREIQQLAHRPNLSTRALYNCIIFLNQLKLVKEEEPDSDNEESSKKSGKGLPDTTSLPASLINTYFQIFEVAVNKGKTKSGKKAKKKEAMKMDLAMKGRLLGALLTGVNRAHPYLPTKDTGMDQHVDSLYKIAHVSPPSACTQALMLLFHLAVGSSSDNTVEEVQRNKIDTQVVSSRKSRFYRVLYSKLADSSMFAGRQMTLFFNLIYKAMKYDDKAIRVVAFGKRLLHVAFHHNPSVVSGALFLVSEVMKSQPLLQSSIYSTEGHGSTFNPTKREPSAAFDVVGDNETDNKSDKETSVDAASLWELSLTISHYHPTVSKFSLSMDEINYRGDPLRDFALVPFLDKFAFRNPKSAKKITEKLRRGESVGERRSGLQGNISALASLPVNDPNFWKKKSAVSEQDEFFQNFFEERAKRDDVKGIVRGKKEDKSSEIDALEAAEGREVDFNWDTDEEEEAFVEKLAESLMESANGGKVNFDDEDPNTDDWSDYDGSDKEEDSGNEGDGLMEFSDFVNAEGLIPISEKQDDDDDTEGDDDDSDNESTSKTEIDDGDDSSNEESEEELTLSFLEEEPASDDDNKGKNSKENQRKEPNSLKSSFADASEYEELINNKMMEQKESKSKRKNEEKDSTDNYSKVNHSGKKKRRRTKAKA